MTTLLMGSVTYFSYKNKLKWFGIVFIKLLNNKILKTYRKISIVTTILFMCFVGFCIITIYLGDNTYHKQKEAFTEIAEKNNIDLTNNDQMIERVSKIEPILFFKTLLELPNMFITQYPIMSGLVGWINTAFHNIPLQLFQIFLIEDVEILSILLYQTKIAKQVLIINDKTPKESIK